MLLSDYLQAVEITWDGDFSSTIAAPIFEDICVQATTFSKVEFCKQSTPTIPKHKAFKD
jgi:hypothetical protein